MNASTSSRISSSAAEATITVALVGNPNTGKSTLFSALAGVRQRIGNYPGVTVEKKTGRLEHASRHFELVDLPGTYSLAPRSPDEMVAVDVLLGRVPDTSNSGVRPPDVVLSIVDASNLERNLYLVSQVLELGLPTVIALNMIDVARRGVEIDSRRLAERLGAPVVELQANKKLGLGELKDALASAAGGEVPRRESPFSSEFQREVAELQAKLAESEIEAPRYLVERLLLDISGYVEQALLDPAQAESCERIREHVGAARVRLAAAGQAVPAIEALARYGWVHQTLEGVVRRPRERRVTTSDKIDRLLTHKIWGTLVFALLMLLVFSSIFSFATPLMDAIDGGVGMLADRIAGNAERPALIPLGALQSLVTDGIIGGVGSVIIFLPQIVVLFFFIAVLEDCGYMARAAYLMDKLMVRAGLSGKSFIPLLSSFACAVPGIMATRVIESPRDRLTTILIAPLMSCSARLPVYIILIGAFIPATTYFGGLVGLQGLTMFGMYLVGIVAAVLVALVLKRTLLRGETPPFVMELPSYKMPTPSVVLHRMWRGAWDFLSRAGTVIFAVAIVVWALAYYPRSEPNAALSDEENAAAQQRQSYLGQMGQTIEPAVRPLGWDWRIGSAAIASFPAREVVMGVLGVIYSLGDVDVGDEEQQESLRERLQAARWDGTGEPVYNIPVALSIMVFFALCAQCAATLAVIRRETNSWRWPVFAFVYMTVLAYVGALVTYQVGIRLIG